MTKLKLYSTFNTSSGLYQRIFYLMSSKHQKYKAIKFNSWKNIIKRAVLKSFEKKLALTSTICYKERSDIDLQTVLMLIIEQDISYSQTW